MPIPSRIQPARPVTSTPSALPVTLSDGDVIEARVAAILPNGQVRLATSLGTTDVATSVALNPGATVRLLVQNVGAQLTLALIESSIASGGSAAGNSAAKAYGSSFTGAQQVLADALNAALPHQASPAALFANLKPLVDATVRGLPQEVTAAARGVLAHPPHDDRPVSADSIRQAVLGSGVFRESRLAAGDAHAALPAQDLKSALLALRTTIAAVVEQFPVPAGAGAQPQGAAQAGAGTRADTLTAPLPGAASAAGPEAGGLAPGSGPGAAAALAARAPGDADHPSPTVPALPAALADALARLPAAARDAALQAIRAAYDPGDPALVRALARAGLSSPSGSDAEAAEQVPPGPASPAKSTGDADEPGRRAHPASIPRIDLPPRAEDPAGPTLREGMDRGEAARILLDQTDATLDRVRLSQYGALHRDDPAQAGAVARDAPAWIFDVPILQGREATSAQVRITRDGRQQSADAAGRRWSVEFALDTTATGPIHAAIRLWGRHVGVTLWAERTETARLLKDQASVLHDALGQAELDVEDVSVLAGSPQPPEAERGYFVDTRS
jgi:hypothetical protein